MGFNADLAIKLSEIAEMLELLGENRFRVNAHQRAARVVKDLAKDLTPIANDPKALIAIEGIGKGIAEKIAQLATTGKIDEHEQLKGRVPPGLLTLLRVPGLGPKKVKLLWDELGVQTVDDLTRTLDDGSAASLKGMGTKTVDNIRESLVVLTHSNERLPIGIARPIAEELLTRVRAAEGVVKAEYAGSLRRGAETIGDLDILVAVKPTDTGQGGAAEKIGEAFRTMPGVINVLAAGPTKSSVRLSLNAFGVNTNRWGASSDEDRTVQADLRVVPEPSWGAALLYFTGSKAHNVRLRELAQTKGLTLNEYGLFPEDQEDTPPQTRGINPVASKTEAQVYKELGVQTLPPTMREDRGELSDHAPSRVVQVADIRAELHSHTTASDGKLSILESATIAKAHGFHTLAITDHSKSSAIAGGLKVERLIEHAAAIRKANHEIEGLTLLAGSEVDILIDGSLDYTDDLLATLDVVVASPHVGLRAKPAQATKRLLKAIEHPMVHILGHPTGRLINKRPGLEPAMDELIAAAVEHDVALEINAHWMRLDLRDTHVRAAVEAGCKIAIDCDVHHANDYDNLIYGVLTGQRGWLTPELCINTWSAKKLHAWLKSKR